MLEGQHPIAIPTRPLGRRLQLHVPGELLISLLLVGCVLLGLYQLYPPAAQATSTSPAEFAAGRAMRQLEVIAASPHPIGSPRNAEVAAYIVEQLAASGLQPHIQTATSVNLEKGNEWQGPVPAGRVRNIVARLAGTDSGKALLLMAHYDSVPNSPGASDDGAAVASLLETLRALRGGPRLKNDVIFLFTDGEEVALLGSKAFVEEHPWARDVGLVLNFEARGYTGPVLMFETSDDNGKLIREFAAAAPLPLANSLTYEVYKLLPNDTDLTNFKDAGFAGLNFTYLDGFTHYHTELDNIETIDQRSLQHHGSYALALTRHFGNLSLDQLRESNAVYFNILRSILVHYPARLVVPLTLAVVALFGAVVVLGLRRGRLRPSGMLLGCIAFLALLVAVPAAVYAVWWSVVLMHPQYRTMLFGETYNSRLYIVAFVALGVALTASFYSRLRRRIRDTDLAAGALIWWALLAVLSAVYLPGGSYLFTWPLLFSVVGLGLVLAANRPVERSLSLAAVLAACAAPGVLLLTPMILLLFVALSVAMSFVAMVLVTLLLGLLIPHMSLLAARRGRLLPALAGATCVLALVLGSLTSGFDTQHPATSNLFYALDADTGKAIWASTDQQPDTWTAQFIEGAGSGSMSEYFPTAASPMMPHTILHSEAPRAELAAPRATLIDDTTRDGRRTLRLRVTSPRRADLLSIHSDPSVRLIDVTIDGKRMLDPAGESSGRPWGVRYWAFPAEGVEVSMTAHADQPIRFKLVDQSYGLPEGPGFSYTPRPDGMMAPPFVGYISDATLVSKSYAF